MLAIAAARSALAAVGAELPTIAIVLYYYRARYYSPALGRFLQTDPIGVRDDLNLYAYVYNDPLNKTDPTGMIAGVDDAAILVGAAVIAGAAAVVCQPGTACNDAASEAITEAGAVIADAHEALVTKIVDEIVEIEEEVKGRMEAREHRKGARKSTKDKHEKGQRRNNKPEKADEVRRPPRQRPGDHKGPWPPKKPDPPKPKEPKPPKPPKPPEPPKAGD